MQMGIVSARHVDHVGLVVPDAMKWKYRSSTFMWGVEKTEAALLNPQFTQRGTGQCRAAPSWKDRKWYTIFPTGHH